MGPQESSVSLREFIVESCNQNAYDIACELVNTLSTDYNPIIFYGPPNSGKTHLLSATYHEIRKHFPEKNSLYIRGDEFYQRYTYSLKYRTYQSFRETHRRCDIFFLEDIHLLVNKKKTQQELMFTLSTLMERKCMILVSSRLHIKEILLDSGLENRLFHGLIIKMDPLSREKIMDYCRQQAHFYKVPIDEKIFETILNSFGDSFGDFRKILHNILICCSSQKTPITSAMVEKAIEKSGMHTRITLEQILREVASYYKLSSPAILQEKTGHRSLLGPKYTAMFLVKELIGMETRDLQRTFGGRSESAVRYAFDKVKEDENLLGICNYLRKKMTHLKEIGRAHV